MAIGYGALQLPAVKSQLAGVLENRIGERTGYEISIGNLSGNIPKEFVFSDVSVWHHGGEQVFSSDKLSMHINAWELLFNTLQVTRVEVENPTVHYSFEHQRGGGLSLMQISLEEDQPEQKTPGFLRTIEIIAPVVSITGGEVLLDHTHYKYENLPDRIYLSQINAELFVEYTSRQQFADIDFLHMMLPGNRIKEVHIDGQLFSDADFLELNALRIRTPESVMQIFAEVSNTGPEGWQDDITGSYFNLRIDRADVLLSEFTDFLPQLNGYNYNVIVDTWLEGDHENIIIRESTISYGDNNITLSGNINNPLETDNISYDGIIREANASSQFLNQISNAALEAYQLQNAGGISLSGNFWGDVSGIALETDFSLPVGDLVLDIDYRFKDLPEYNIKFEGEAVDMSRLETLGLPSTNLNMTGSLIGSGITASTIDIEADITFRNSFIADSDFQFLHVNGRYTDRYFEPNLEYRNRDEILMAESSLQLGDGFVNVWMDGTAENINLIKLRPFISMPSSSINLDFMMDIQLAENLDESFGWMSADIRKSEVDSIEVREHQFYFDLDPPDVDSRNLRFTSTFMDVLAAGNIKPLSVYALQDVWLDYFRNRYDEEILLEDAAISTIIRDAGAEIFLDLVAEIKDVELMKHYFPNLPISESSADIQFNVRADENELEIDGIINDRRLAYNGVEAENLEIHLYTNLRRDQRIREFSVLDIDVNSGFVRYNGQRIRNMAIDLALRDGRAMASTSAGQIGENITLNSEFSLDLHEGGFQANIDQLQFGSPEYMWRNVSRAVFEYNEPKRFVISDFEFESDEQYILIHGVYSPFPEDQLRYEMRRFDLSRVSDAVDGRFAFSGLVDGDLTTQSLTREPVIEGDLLVDGFSLDGRIVGDIRFRSLYNQESRQFESNISVLTDDVKYADILESQSAIGQQIYLDGVFESPATREKNNRLFHFDVDIVKSDLWFLPLIMPDVLVQTEGKATGKGVITGDVDRIDFAGDLYAEDAAIWPVFFNTKYYAEGPVQISRDQGVHIDNLRLRDDYGGRGRLYGTYDFNDFQQERFIDISLEMDNLIFLNNEYDPDVPFYGTVFGTGTANISGSNLEPYVRTIVPVVTSSRSSISIPLLPETRVEERGRFIHFVNDFSDIATFDRRTVDDVDFSGVDQTFTELFRLDLQFIADQNNNVRLIFDPVTDEIMSARGSGRMRILLDDEEYSMFGNFEVSEGDYLFVGGDIFTRRFDLREGGTITWDGDPVNARLNVLAAYRSRPNINALLGIDQQDVAPQRIPVDLLLEITGTMDHVENDFYFEFPNSVDAAQNAAVLNILNSEEQKFLQATSLLLTGGFIPTGVEGQSDQFFATTQSRAGQVGVSQLLSTQINSIINANLANLDIDFNLTGFDQADLGIALRLFDDRLELRRDGQVAGDQTDIGDLGAKYRISNTLSVEVFHRKDPSLIAIIGTQGGQVESVNGVGLEAQMQFNTWKELRNRVWGSIKNLFVRREDDDDSVDSVALAN